MAIDLATFREIRKEDKETLNHFFTAADNVLSVYNFANLYMWGELYHYQWTVVEERLLIYREHDDVLIMPIGQPLSVAELVEISDALRGQGRSGNVAFVPTEYGEGHDELQEYFELQLDEDNADYVYSTTKLAELSGRKLHKKKNLLNQFLRNHPEYAVKRLEPHYYEQCLQLSEHWCDEKVCDRVAFAYETDALRRGFDYWDELELDGLLIVVGGEIVGFSVFGRQNSTTALVHLEKFARELKGAAQVINWETARHLVDTYQFLNREQDLGIEGLRQAKESYLPEYKALSYRLLRKE